MPDLPPLFGSRTLTGLILILGLLVFLTIGVGAVILTSGETDGNQGISWGERILAAATALGIGHQVRETRREVVEEKKEDPPADTA